MTNAPTGMRDYRSASYLARAKDVASGNFTPSERRKLEVSLMEKGFTPKYLKSLTTQEIKDLSSKKNVSTPSTSTIPSQDVSIRSENIVRSPVSGVSQVAISGSASTGNVLYSQKKSVVSAEYTLIQMNQMQQFTYKKTNPNKKLQK